MWVLGIEPGPLEEQLVLLISISFFFFFFTIWNSEISSVSKILGYFLRSHFHFMCKWEDVRFYEHCIKEEMTNCAGVESVPLHFPYRRTTGL